jgi:hypothetical protein
MWFAIKNIWIILGGYLPYFWSHVRSLVSSVALVAYTYIANML